MSGEPTEPVEPKTDPVDPKEKVTGSTFYKEKLAAIQADNLAKDNALKELQAKIEEIEHNKLAETNNFKSLYEIEKNKRTEAESKAKKLAESFFNDKKMSVVKQEALKAGIDETCLKWLDKADTTTVQIEHTSTGNINILGANEFIEAFKAENPTFFPSKTAPKINNAAPGGKAEMSAADILKLEKTDPVAYQKAIADMQAARK